MGEIRVGVSGWNYPEWRKGVVYPTGLRQRDELSFVGERLDSIELNGTFYSLQSPKSFANWHDAVPEDVIFALKGSKFITHQKKLSDVRIPLANFFASGILKLGQKLGPILWQLPPWYHYDRKKIEVFLKLLPRTAADAAQLSRENTIKKPDGAWTELIENVPIRYAIEPRHESFFTEDLVELLRELNVALAFADTADKFAYAEDVTADIIYVRMHGGEQLYASDYREAELDRLAKRLQRWAMGGEPRDAVKIAKSRPKSVDRDVFVYFDNTMEGHAFHDAIYLSGRLGIERGSAAVGPNKKEKRPRR